MGANQSELPCLTRSFDNPAQRAVQLPNVHERPAGPRRLRNPWRIFEYRADDANEFLARQRASFRDCVLLFHKQSSELFMPVQSVKAGSVSERRAPSLREPSRHGLAELERCAPAAFTEAVHPVSPRLNGHAQVLESSAKRFEKSCMTLSGAIDSLREVNATGFLKST